MILTHGWQGSAASWYRLVPMLQEAGFSVVVFDAPGHSGRPRLATLPVYSQGLADIAALFSPIHALVGHSFGGMASARVAQALPDLKALVTIGTPDRVRCLVDGFSRKLGLRGASLEAFEQRLVASSQVPVDDEATSLYMSRLNCPTLVMHDVDDEVIPLEDGYRIASSASTELVVSEGLGHRTIIRDSATLTRVVEFLRTTLPPSD